MDIYWIGYRSAVVRMARFACLALLGVVLVLAYQAAPAYGAESKDSGSSQTDKKSEDKSKSKSEQSSKESEGGKSQGSEKNEAKSFDYDQLIERAKKLSKKSYKAPKKVPDFLTKLSEDDWSKIHFKRDQALWYGKRPFEVMFYHPGSYYDHTVTIHVVKDGKTHEVKFDKSDFNYPDQDLKKKVPDDLGFAGLKILHTLADSGKLDEVLSFLGASYFRALGADEHYGTSARGLAIDTGNLNKGEEFPQFTDFWLVQPDQDSDPMVIYALLDSPSVTGAYKFTLKPGGATHIHVEATLFTRKAISKLGVAPLTSMFTWGESSLAHLQDFRPEAHDADGMLIASADGEWLWRPLVNPQKLWMHQYDADNVRGFGLSQRDRNFEHYQDLQKQYQKRPNVWITPDGDWGKGHLELVEIPSDSEVNDNIVLYWVPKKQIKADKKLHFAYDMKWSSSLAEPCTMGHVVATRVGKVASDPGHSKDRIKVAVDFVGGELSDFVDADSIQPKVSAMRDVKLHDIKAIRNPHTGGWRLLFSVATDDLGKPLQLRAYLADADDGALTETWSYLLALP